MKIVTYNVNGLRPRIAQFGSLQKLLQSFDADIICFQETKLRRQELKADLVMADGYESFFSCTRTSEKGRTAYSGVATFCRIKSAFSSNEVSLPVAAEEGFTGLLENSQTGKAEMPAIADALEEFAKDELRKLDSEGRCIITDHGHFVLFNIYGPRAESDDTERIQFKLNFFKILRKRWESLVSQGRRIVVVGDLNIAPTSMDRCDAGPDFENNEFRRWFRSLLVENGGDFLDVFRAKHPDRRDAYTCWPQNTGAEVFNFGTRIDHMLCAGSCLHQEHNPQGNNFVTCHVRECDILTQYKRWKEGNTFRWKGERTIKLEGSDHAPVFMNLGEIPDVPLHSTPSLSARYLPMIHGVQQTLVSLLMKRQTAQGTVPCKTSSLFTHENITRSLDSESCSSSNQVSESVVLKTDENPKDLLIESTCSTMITYGNERIKKVVGDKNRKRARSSQLSLKSFFQNCSNLNNDVDNIDSDISVRKVDVSQFNQCSIETPVLDVQNGSTAHYLSSPQDKDAENACSLEKEKSNVALLEWQRIQNVMRNSIPLCKGHSEPCVARVVKKQGPNFGRRFYACARAEGPASNPEANCGYFKWAASKSRNK